MMKARAILTYHAISFNILGHMLFKNCPMTISHLCSFFKNTVGEMRLRHHYMTVYSLLFTEKYIGLTYICG